MKQTLLILFIGVLFNTIHGQQFVEKQISANPEGFYLSSMDFGDIDNDGDIDMIILGNLNPGVKTKIYLNEENTFVESSNTLPFLNSGCVEMFDSDGDGDLDLILSGRTDDYDAFTFLYLNDGQGNFEDSNVQNLANIEFSSCATADVDADGDLDLLLNGFNGASSITQLYFNDGKGGFTADTQNSFLAADDGDAVFVDVDADGDMDLFVSGWDENSVPNSILYINDGTGSFSQSSSQLDGVVRSRIVPADVDGDEDIDVLISGIVSSSLHQTKLYLNDGEGNYTASTIGLFPNIGNGAASGADIDLDGDVDFLISGNAAGSFSAVSELYLNNGDGSFILGSSDFDGIILGQTSFVDYDQDGDEDLFLSGLNSGLNAVHRLYENTQILSSLSENELNPIGINIYPNIVQTESAFKIEMNSDFSQDISLKMYDISGKMVSSLKFNIEANVPTTKELITPAQPGVYYINLNNKQYSERLIVIH